MSELKVKGVIKEIQDLQRGQKKDGSGEWVRLNFVVDVPSDGQYSDMCPFTMFKPEAIDKFLQYNKEGDTVEVSFNIRGREYEGRWYTDLVAWRVWKDNPNAAPTPKPDMVEAEEDDLPF